jgi:hypothetical protein
MGTVKTLFYVTVTFDQYFARRKNDAVPYISNRAQSRRKRVLGFPHAKARLRRKAHKVWLLQFLCVSNTKTWLYCCSHSSAFLRPLFQPELIPQSIRSIIMEVASPPNVSTGRNEAFVYVFSTGNGRVRRLLCASETTTFRRSLVSFSVILYYRYSQFSICTILQYRPNGRRNWR